MSLLENKLELMEESQRMATEIEALRKENAELSQRLNIYETAADGANDGLWDWDFEHNRPFVSRPWKAMLGIAEDAEVDMNGLWESLLHPEDHKEATEAFHSFIEGDLNDYRQEFRMKHADGSYRWILSKAKAVRDQDGKAIRISGSHTDITDRKLSANALKFSEEKYRSIFENSLVGMFRTNFKTGEIIESNEKFWQIVGVDKADGYSTMDFYKSPKDRDFVVGLVRDNGKAENVELEIKRADGELIWVNFSIKHYKDEGILETIILDITETKNNLLELQKVNFELDSFVYHASHDLRSPLRSILGLIDLYRLEDTPQVREQCIERIEGSVKRLDDLVMELLSISRNDRINDPHVEVNMMVEVNNSISSYYNATNTDNLEIRAKIYQPVVLKTDATRVRIILNNIISNAIKYRSFHKENSLIDIEVHVNDKEAVISIEDNGEGIEESKLPHIFDMFYRATEKSVGSGLGLYIVKKVADKLNAIIDVTSEEWEGTTFKITIPNSLHIEE
ncbi:PAS domain-containing sensor histidine kinase [Fulvivirga lutimaris]|uniref:PAS domain-containing sensor histidine kinase n=1 Tax=Fulvivirga lutimaris TaxID=1819566 RepID=UPI0012BC0937|nr:ATP-binding protein [Fulvivirga lutimaris]MTI41311.1 PAS domain S-box protein [Fulvivirga lutimaris]